MSQPLNVGIAGLGTVGSSVVRILERRANALASATGRSIRIAGISAQGRNKRRDFSVDNYRWFDDPVELAGSKHIDVFVEAIGGRDGPALRAIECALDNGKSVVTANKALLANHGMALAAKAEERNLVLNFEAVVAGGIPIIKQLREALIGNQIEKIYGILNGTCNYILTKMADEKISYEDALRNAQDLGYAEADPATDVDGIDTAHKLAVLATLAFGIKLNHSQVSCEGIRNISAKDIADARSLGYEIKLLGIAERQEGSVLLRVHPSLVPHDAPLSQVSGVLNAVSIKADAVNLTTIGPGAGGEATASAVVADIADIARGHGLKLPLLRQVRDLEDCLIAPLSDHRGAFFLSMVVEDKVGVFAKIATEMAKRHISLESIKQFGKRSNHLLKDRTTIPLQEVVLVTHEASEADIRATIEAIRATNFVHGDPKLLRIES